MNEPSTLQVVEAMEKHGGRFIRALAAAFRDADPVNRLRIRGCWSEEWEVYRKFAIYDIEFANDMKGRQP